MQKIAKILFSTGLVGLLAACSAGSTASSGVGDAVGDTPATPAATPSIVQKSKKNWAGSAPSALRKA